MTDEETAAVTVESDDLTHEIVESSGSEVTDADLPEAEDAADAADAAGGEPFAPTADRAGNGSRTAVVLVLVVLALLLAAAAGYLGWRQYQAGVTNAARVESVRVAKESTIKLLSYQPDTVDQQLNSARDLLTGDFRDSYTQLINDVVIPGARQKKIAAIANVPAVASESATPTRAVALVFVNQSVTVDGNAPTSTNSSVRVTLDKVGDRWLISEFDPV